MSLTDCDHEQPIAPVKNKPELTAVTGECVLGLQGMRRERKV